MARVQDLDPARVREELGKTESPGAFVAAIERLAEEAHAPSDTEIDAGDGEQIAEV